MDIKSFMKQIKVPTQEEIEQMVQNSYVRSKENKNNMSYWLPYVVGIGFNTPETTIIQLPYEWFKWLRGDKYTEDKINEFTEYLKDKLNHFDTDRELFIKTGVFSNKFLFRSCKLNSVDNIGKQFLEIYYSSAIVGASDSSEVVVREYIKGSNEREKIYEGMPLNTEFRVFYDFDKQDIMGIFNYWDKDVMLENLQGKDKEVFAGVCEELEEEYEKEKQVVLDTLNRHIGKCKLEGQWSLDFMLVDNKIWLVDMSLAKESYYYNMIEK